MANPIKYSTTQVTNTIKKGNSVFGVGNNGFGTTEQTGFWAGVDPPTGGYTVYVNPNGTSGPGIYITDDNSLPSLVNQIGASGITTLSGALEWIDTQPDIVCVNREYEGIVTDGLVLNLDAGFIPSYCRSGTTWTDLSGNGNNGTLTNGPTFNSSNGGSIVFDGVDDYVLCNPISTSLNANVGATLGLWCKVSVGETQAILLSYLTLNTNNGFRLQIYNGPLAFTLGAVADYSTGINISDNTWKYITSTSSGNTTRVYINGVLRSTITMGTMVGGTLNTYIVGKSGFTDSYYLSGTIGQVQSYNRALTAQEVSQNFNATKSRFGL